MAAPRSSRRAAPTRRTSARSPAPRRRAAARRPAARRTRTPARPKADPRFSVRFLDRSVEPRNDFYRYAAGGWIKTHPVPADKARWDGFSELVERNFDLLRKILEESASSRSAPAGSPARIVGDLYASAMDTKRREQLAFAPIAADRARIDAAGSLEELLALLPDLHSVGVGGLFDVAVYADRKRSDTYALYLWQGGLTLPDREYYLADSFAKVRAAYRRHLTTMFRQIGRSATQAAADAGTVLELETALAKGSRSAVEQRDSQKNYNRTTPAELAAVNPATRWNDYFRGRGFGPLEYVVVGQPEFFGTVDRLLRERTLEDWKVYLTWQLLHAAAPHLHDAAESEDFAFFHATLLGQKEPEPRWRRAAREVDGAVGEALGKIYVDRHFPAEARRRMASMVEDLRAVFRTRLAGLEWMTPATRKLALEKFDRFTAKIGHPAKFRDYRSVGIARDDYVGNLRRAAAFESRRHVERVGKPVDRTEWHMTPPTVNAYFDATQNEIVFPAGILQPPFFDLKADDALNYGGIGTVIGHEITHGYDDQGRQYDADGNLRDWWTEGDATEFTARARRVIEEYGSFEVLPGLRVNGELTQGENIADFGGVSIAFEALQRRLDAHPKLRRSVDGFTPEQRFFLSFAQLWRQNMREPEVRRRITIDPHSPGRFRATGPLASFPPFYEAFGVRPGDGMYRAPDRRGNIW